MIPLIIVLIVAGLLFLGIEIFIPGMVVGLLGGLCIMAAMALILIAPGLSGLGMGGRILLSLSVAVFCAAAMFTWTRTFHLTPMGKLFIQSESIEGTDINPTRIAMVGKTGVALTDLRPVGNAEIEGSIYESRAQSGTIAKDSAIEVVAAAPGQLVVRVRDEEEEDQDEASPEVLDA